MYQLKRMPELKHLGSMKYGQGKNREVTVYKIKGHPIVAHTQQIWGMHFNLN